MNSPGFESAHPLATCILYLLAWLVFSAAVLWPFSRPRLLDRLPFVLCILNMLLAGAIGVLPEAFPRAFKTILNHPIYAESSHLERDGVTVSEPWIEHWDELVGGVDLWISGVGAVWAVINLFRRRALVLNTVAAACTLWVLFYGLSHVI